MYFIDVPRNGYVPIGSPRLLTSRNGKTIRSANYLNFCFTGFSGPLFDCSSFFQWAIVLSINKYL